MGAADHAFLAVSETHAAVAAALRAASSLPAPAPVQAVDYVSAGRTLIIGPADIALDWAERLKDRLDVAVLVIEARGNEELPPRADYSVHAGCEVKVEGWLGSFKVQWQQVAMPEAGEIGALDFGTTTPRTLRPDLRSLAPGPDTPAASAARLFLSRPRSD